MKSITVAEVIASLDAAHVRDPQGVLAFDADGTLWEGDVGEDFFEAMLEFGLAEEAVEGMRNLARRHGLATEGDARALYGTIYDAWQAELLPERAVVELVAWAGAGRKLYALDELLVRVTAREVLAPRLQRETRAIVEWAAARAIEVFVVSASPACVVERAVHVLNLPASHVVGVRHRTMDGGVIVADVEHPVPYNDGKVEALRERIGSRPVLAAFGDNVFDIPLLKSAELGVVVRPKKRLLARQEELADFARLEA